MVTPETVISHVSLCAGYGGIDLGLRRVLPACRTILMCEVEAYACAVLLSKMEEGSLDACPIWTDIKALPLEFIPEGIGILSGGFPCTPFSQIGRRKSDQDPRHLFPYIKDAIRSIQPEWVFLENVEGIISAKLGGDGWGDPAGTPVLLHVLRELERIGYEPAWGIFSAAECGHPHQRKRVFILAKLGDSKFAGLEGHSRAEQGEGRREIPFRPVAPPDFFQHEWERPRTISKSGMGGATDGAGARMDATEHRVDRLRMIGNGCCPDTVAKAWVTLRKNFP